MATYKRFLLCVLITSLTYSAAFAKDNDDKHKDKGLPPGLEKRAEQGKSLPPGWQKKLNKGDVLDSDLYLRGRVVTPVGDDGIVSIEVEGTLIKLFEKTHVIVDFKL